jgi:hypothetical protein
VAASGSDGPDRPADPGGSGSIDVELSGSLPAAKVRRRAQTLGGRVVDSLEQAAEKLHIPMPKARKSRVLIRSVVVGFLVVAAWIVGLVWWQLRGASKPDLRPVAQHILEQLRTGDYDKVYAEASPRLQEIVLEGSFAKQMADMYATLGAFKEITSVTGTELVHGPSGTSARVALVMTFDKASKVRGSISFHREEGEWKLLGVQVDLPPEIARIETAEDKRLARVQGDPIVIVDALGVLLRLQKGDTDGVWNDAADVFKTAVSMKDLGALEQTRRKEIGKFARIVDVTSNKKSPSETGDSLDMLLEYDAADKPILSVHFEFSRLDQYRPWSLASYKPIMPMPRVPSK